MCVEWGSVAEWVTAGVAVAAAGAAFWALRYNKAANAHAQDAAIAAASSNELTAQAYRDDVRVRDEAQARLVYATVDGGHQFIMAGTELPKPWDSNATPAPTPDFVYVHASGAGVRYVSESARTIVVHVHNKSTEIISSIRVALFHTSERRELDSAVGWVVLLPDEQKAFEFVVPFDDERYVPDITFRDATGKYWSRRGFNPIAAVPDARRNELGLPKAP